MSRVAVVFALLVALSGHSEALAAVAVPHGYEQAVAMLPEHHWALVAQVDLVNRDDFGNTYHDRRIEIPRRADPKILIHEVGHVVAVARPDLEAEYIRRFWTGKHDPHEQFAEAYRAVIEGRSLDKDEARYMREHVLTARAIEPAVSSIQAQRPVETSAGCGGNLPSGSIVAGCSMVPNGSVR